MLVVDYDGREAARGDLRTAEGRAAIERFFASFCADELRGPPKVLHAPGFSFSDVAAKVVSIINLASVADLENYTGAPVDPLRFRGNLYVSGWPAWQELDMVGRRRSPIGNGVAAEDRQAHRALRRDQRRSRKPARATSTIPDTLMKTFGHADCGIYGQVIAPGTVAVGDELRS